MTLVELYEKQLMKLYIKYEEDKISLGEYASKKAKLLKEFAELEKKQKCYSEQEVLDILFELACNNDDEKEEMKEWFEAFYKK